MSHAYRLARPVPGTEMTMRQHLLNAIGTARDPGQLEALTKQFEGPGVPEVCEHLLPVWQALNGKRTSTGFAVNPITHGAMRDYCALTGAVLDPWEVAVLDGADVAFRTELGRKEGEKVGPDEE